MQGPNKPNGPQMSKEEMVRLHSELFNFELYLTLKHRQLEHEDISLCREMAELIEETLKEYDESLG